MPSGENPGHAVGGLIGLEAGDVHDRAEPAEHSYRSLDVYRFRDL